MCDDPRVPTPADEVPFAGPRAPVAVCEVDGDGAAVAVDPRYTAARVLVRRDGTPVAWVHVPLTEGRASAEVVRAAVGAAAADVAPDPGAPPATAAVTVVLCTVGRPELLERALRSLLASDHPELEVLVVDNRPSDPATRELVTRLTTEARGPRLRLVDEPVPGLSAARNRGITSATHDLIAFTDDDVVVDPAWARWLTAPLVAGDAEVTTGLVLPLELETQPQIHFEGYGGFARGMQRRAFRLDLTADDRAEHPDHLVYPFNGGSFGSGNAMAFTRAALERIGGFDPALGAGTLTGGGEDIDAFSHLVLTGSTLVYEPRAVCWHAHRRDEASLVAQIRSYGTGFGAVLTKWTLRSPRLRRGLLRRSGTMLAALRPGRPAAVRDRPESPPELSALELRGMLVSPWLYARSRRRAAAVRPLLARVGPHTTQPRSAGPGL